MINLALRTEYSFKKTFGKITDICETQKEKGFIGIADINTSYGHFKLEKECKKHGITPIFAVRLEVTKDEAIRDRSFFGSEYIFIAKNDNGLKQIYQLIKCAYDNFYFRPQLPYSVLPQINRNNIFILSQNPIDLDYIDYIALSPSTSKMIEQIDFPKIAVNDNAYTTTEEKQIYQLLAGARKHGDGFRFLFDDQTYPRHILSEKEILRLWPNNQKAIEATYEVAEQCKAKIQVAPMVRYDQNYDLRHECLLGAKKLNIKIQGEYEQRLNKEIDLINEKDYGDYFMIVHDLVKDAKKKMLVGPARGSAAGSLV